MQCKSSDTLLLPNVKHRYGASFQTKCMDLVVKATICNENHTATPMLYRAAVISVGLPQIVAMLGAMHWRSHQWELTPPIGGVTTTPQ